MPGRLTIRMTILRTIVNGRGRGVEGDRGGGGDVERIGARLHRDADALVGGRAASVGETRALGAEQQRGPLGPLDLRRSGSASAPGVSANVVKPAPSARSSTDAIRVHGIRSTCPIDTRTQRRYSGSEHSASSSTASTPSAAALRNSTPRFSWSLTRSSTATRRAPSSTGRDRGQRPAVGRRDRAPVQVEPDDPAQHRVGRDVDRHVRAEHRPRGRRTARRTGAGVTSTDRTRRPDSSSRRTTSGDSAMKNPSLGLDPPAQVGIGEVDVVGQARDRRDRRRRRARARRPPWHGARPATGPHRRSSRRIFAESRDRIQRMRFRLPIRTVRSGARAPHCRAGTEGGHEAPAARGSVRGRARPVSVEAAFRRVRLLVGALVLVRLCGPRARSPMSQPCCSSLAFWSINGVAYIAERQDARTRVLLGVVQLLADTLVVLLVAWAQHGTRPGIGRLGGPRAARDRGRDPVPGPRRGRELARARGRLHRPRTWRRRRASRRRRSPSASPWCCSSRCRSGISPSSSWPRSTPTGAGASRPSNDRSLLRTAALGGRRISRLDVDEIIDVICTTVGELGFADPQVFELVAARRRREPRSAAAPRPCTGSHAANPRLPGAPPSIVLAADRGPRRTGQTTRATGRVRPDDPHRHCCALPIPMLDDQFVVLTARWPGRRNRPRPRRSRASSCSRPRPAHRCTTPRSTWGSRS